MSITLILSFAADSSAMARSKQKTGYSPVQENNRFQSPARFQLSNLPLLIDSVSVVNLVEERLSRSIDMTDLTVSNHTGETLQ